MRIRFEEQLAQLNGSLIEMAEIVKKAIADANKALIDQDVELAQRIIDSDDEIDDKEEEIESMCLKLLLQQQPVAGDLRLVSAIMKIITALERIGDHATDISELTLLLADEQYIKKLEHIPQMAVIVIQMVKDGVQAYINRDIELARSLDRTDDKVDRLFNVVMSDLTALIKKDPDNAEQAIMFMMITKYLERIGDHAVNIGEWVEYAIMGRR